MQGMVAATGIMKRSGHEYRQLKDQCEHFSLSGLLLGQWHVQIAPDAISDDLRA